MTVVRDMRLLDLKSKLFESAATFTKAQGFAAHSVDPASAQTRQAALEYQAAAPPYEELLDECEEYLPYIERDDNEETDLQHILTYKRDVEKLLALLE